MDLRGGCSLKLCVYGFTHIGLDHICSKRRQKRLDPHRPSICVLPYPQLDTLFVLQRLS